MIKPSDAAPLKRESGDLCSLINATLPASLSSSVLKWLLLCFLSKYVADVLLKELFLRSYRPQMQDVSFRGAGWLKRKPLNVRIWCVTLKLSNCVAYISISYVHAKGSTSVAAVSAMLVKGFSKHLVFHFNGVWLLFAINRRGN